MKITFIIENDRVGEIEQETRIGKGFESKKEAKKISTKIIKQMIDRFEETGF